ncbi:MAG: NAD-dependent epimerase/dehydratase family protein [Spirobacillus cienkowskii]|jgi:UDP-glucuronate decarboxylase|uniref:UDP-glucuronate decarboxylase n=1 Tax=Spirobacillus cienkowskii TaxID=495820 RepID=A0A369KKB4_9BACT|nr:MAG: NAD-dependent epimerase/dehydratase family protein [Spirobacillus cienkowskii]
MNILITGGAGFIGYHVAYELLMNNNTVYSIDNFLSGQKENILLLQKKFPKNFIFKEIDVLNFNDILSFLGETKIDQIFHLACPASPPIYQRNPLNTLDICYLGSKNMLDLAKLYNAKILLASTSEVYGDPLVHPQSEDYKGNVNTYGIRACYDEGKRAMETLGFIYLQMKVDVKIARIFNTYGPRMSSQDGRLLTNFIIQGLKKQDLTVYGDGEQTRSLCYCTDLINGLIKLMNSNINFPINLGSQFELKVIDIAKLVIKLLNSNLKIIFNPLPEDDPKQRMPDISKAKMLLNWSPEVSLEDGISSMILDFKERFN